MRGAKRKLKAGKQLVQKPHGGGAGLLLQMGWGPLKSKGWRRNKRQADARQVVPLMEWGVRGMTKSELHFRKDTPVTFWRSGERPARINVEKSVKWLL